MTRPRVSLKSLVAEKIETEKHEKFFQEAFLAIRICSLMRDIIITGDPEQVQIELGRIRKNFEAELGPGKWEPAIIKATHAAYGDPKEMFQNIDRTRGFSVPYWNPTNNRINVFPLGLMRLTALDTVFIDFVEPGERVMIPIAYTIGGKHSSLSGVAPQLRKLDSPNGHDELLDLGPSSFNEWCTFGLPGELSKCCDKQVLWSETKCKLICQNCRKDC